MLINLPRGIIVKTIQITYLNVYQNIIEVLHEIIFKCDYNYH